MSTLFLEDIEVGLERATTRVVTDNDIQSFADMTGDNNPVHFCDDYAAGTVFKERVAHGMLTAGLFSAIIGEQLPGHGAIYLSQSLKFKAPVRPGDTADAICTVREVNREKRRLLLDCVCRVGDTVVIEGEAVVLAPTRGTA